MITLPEGSTSTVKQEQTELKRKPLRPWNVVLLDDNDHTYDYVVRMLRTLFGHSSSDAYQMAKEVDRSGRVIVLTTHRERAELERHRIHNFGADPLNSHCKGSMSSVIEPAQGS
jgi:ATP-dependent Clp protease adaptor protein ClpS